MAEITSADYATFAEALSTDDEAIQAALDAALAGARRYCGWHVSPVLEDQEVTLNGPGGWRLFLRTKKLISVDSVVEDGEELQVGVDVVADPETPGMLVRKWGSWTREPASIAVTFTHGYTEEEAADWRRAVLRLARLYLRADQRDNPDLKRKKVDDVELEWFEGVISTDAQLSALFAPFRILPSP